MINLFMTPRNDKIYHDISNHCKKISFDCDILIYMIYNYVSINHTNMNTQYILSIFNLFAQIQFKKL